MIELIIGGARSGKSSYGEKCALARAAERSVDGAVENTVESRQNKPIYVATAEAVDREIEQRIRRHKNIRADQWETIECPYELSSLLHMMSVEATTLNVPHIVMIDCMTMWLNNHLYRLSQKEEIKVLSKSRRAKKYESELNDLRSIFINNLRGYQQSTEHTGQHLFIVTNEVGSGIVPLGVETRVFADHQGWLNQQLAEVADRVTLVTAGIPLTIKSS